MGASPSPRCADPGRRQADALIQLIHQSDSRHNLAAMMPMRRTRAACERDKNGLEDSLKLQERSGLGATSRSVLSTALLLLAPSLVMTQTPRGDQSAQSGGMQTTQNTQTAEDKQDIKLGTINN
jgi:hypothetical protein